MVYPVAENVKGYVGSRGGGYGLVSVLWQSYKIVVSSS